MVDVNIASNTEKIENRQASGVIQYEGSEGDLVGLDSNGDVVAADADTASTVKARGVLLGGAKDPANYGNDFAETRLVVESEYDLVGEARKTFFEYGVRLRNADKDWDFTPGADVYLAVGGGYTDTNPDPDGSLGHLVQKVGYAKPAPGEEGDGVANEVVVAIDHTA